VLARGGQRRLARPLTDGAGRVRVLRDMAQGGCMCAGFSKGNSVRSSRTSLGQNYATAKDGEEGQRDAAAHPRLDGEAGEVEDLGVDEKEEGHRVLMCGLQKRRCSGCRSWSAPAPIPSVEDVDVMAKLLAWWSWQGRRGSAGRRALESLSMASPRSIFFAEGNNRRRGGGKMGRRG
jgi:hypothetical protein